MGGKTRSSRRGAITKQAMKKAERDLKFKCPLDSEFQIGDSWKETH